MWCRPLGSSGSCFPPPTHRPALGAILDPQSMGSAVKDHMTQVRQSEASPPPTLHHFVIYPLTAVGEVAQGWGEGGVGGGRGGGVAGEAGRDGAGRGGRSDMMGFGLHLNEVTEFGSELKVGKLGLPWWCSG